jgi:membrane-associated PAP2 superfamily phosphatase
MHGQWVDMAQHAVPAPTLRPNPAPVDARIYVGVQLILVPILIGALAWWCEYGPLDMLLTLPFVDLASHDFFWRDSLMLDVLGHLAARGLPIMVGGIAFSAGLAGFAVRQLRPWAPILLTTGAAIVIGPLAVNLLRGITTQHCPIDLQAFGGVIDYAAEQTRPFWAAAPQSAGHCLPSGHAAGGYALLSLYFAGWAAGRSAWRWRGLAIGIGTGLAFSAVRVSQGANFTSATLWSAAVLWATCATLFLPLLCWRPIRAA